ncbi:MAG: hypothetical protein WDW38_005323 [Sanguina aurantia]
MAPPSAQSLPLKQSTTSIKARSTACWLKSSEGAAQLQCVSSSSSINLSLRVRGDVIFSQDLFDSLYAVRIVGQARAGTTTEGNENGLHLLLLVPATGNGSRPTFCFRWVCVTLKGVSAPSRRVTASHSNAHAHTAGINYVRNPFFELAAS